MHSSTQHSHNNGHGHSHTYTAAVANQTQEQSFAMMHRDAQDILYVDYMGSIMEALTPEEGEFILNNAMNMRLKVVRGWKRDGHPNPNAMVSGAMMATPVAPPPQMQAPGGASPANNRSEPTIAEPASNLPGSVDKQ